MIARFLLLISAAVWFVVAFTGCGANIATYYKGVATGFNVAESCSEFSGMANKDKETEIKKLADADKVVESKALRESWRPTYEKIALSCKALLMGAKVALKAGPVVEKAVNRDKLILDWLVKSAALVVEVVARLGEIGIKIPGGGL